ncbi:MAG: HEAT repeat domain-containing protein [Planctomycetota bacterium]|nr:HEAT repeat domain-containing protein [Planctomycetota bacterium]
MSRLALLLCALALLLATAPEAEAHGGRLKPPPEEEPPPEDVPPGPPPPPQMPDRPGGGVPPPPPAPPTTNDPDDTGGGTPDATSPGNRGRASPWEERWQSWWKLNRWAWLPGRHALRDRPDVVVTPSASDEPEPDPRDAWEAARALGVREQIAPALQALLADPHGALGELRSASLIALAKTHATPEVLELLLEYANDRGRASLIRESAAIAVGLLRRSEDELALDGTTLDVARFRLLRLIDDKTAPTRTRAFAALSLGLLADQPYGTPFTQRGRVVAHELWDRLDAKRASDEVAVALLTALSQQPPAGVKPEVLEKLSEVVLGRRVHSRAWTERERAHALTARARLGGKGSVRFVLRTLSASRLPKDVRRAALLAAAEMADRVTEDERGDLATAVLRAESSARSPLTKGLRRLALGRIVGADLRAGCTRLLKRGNLVSELLSGPQAGAVSERAFSTLALGIAVHGVETESKSVASFRKRSLDLLGKALDRNRGGDEQQGATVIALGLAGDLERVPAIVAILNDTNRAPDMRGHAATALGMIGSHKHGVPKALRRALTDRRSDVVPSEAGLALALLGMNEAGDALVKSLMSASTERGMAHGALALGQLGDLQAIPALLEAANDDKRSTISRAMAVAALGLLADPERRPSLFRLSTDACYTALTNALHEAFTIL